MDKKILILLAIIAVIGLFFFIRNNNQFSITRQLNAETIEYDTEVPCTMISDCSQIQNFPSDGYCKEGTCRMKISTANLYAQPFGG